ncbi:hypothetical protein F8M41_012547 [Gigaspora margarita]|uniref:Uncharacterized protein n=1 Tax=Gigaspora margarita TaxID=4874 RepID=A0A8H3WZH7_GIGMA|nr:hypothetical protein F8M41_012547 [Gigaspora margarita]
MLMPGQENKESECWGCGYHGDDGYSFCSGNGGPYAMTNEDIGKTNEDIGKTNEYIGKTNEDIGKTNEDIGKTNEGIGKRQWHHSLMTLLKGFKKSNNALAKSNNALANQIMH